MDFQQLLDTVGLWPALVLALAWWIDRIRREQLQEKNEQIERLEDEARKSLMAKDMENAEWKRIALSALESTKRTTR